MMNKKKLPVHAEFSYYDLYLLNYLRENRFPQAADTAFIRERALRASMIYERARLDGYPVDSAQELAMATLVHGLHHSPFSILHEVVENEFYDDIPEGQRTAFIEGLFPFLDKLFSRYDLSDDHFAQSFGYSRLYTELTGSVLLHIETYGI